MTKPLVAIVGRPNVGKSTLFNRIIGKRMAIVDDAAGITRDRIYAEADWNGRDFVVIDTGGILLNETDPLRIQVTAQAQVALDEADVVLFTVDADAGISPLDQEIADKLRAARTPVIVVANKADNTNRENDALEFYQLGLGDVHPISALNGRSVGDLLDVVVAALPERGEEEYPEDTARIAILGRPNVGKSSLLNAILGQKRVIVSDIPGTTRDTVDTVFTTDRGTAVLIDTAGIRKTGQVQGTVEYYTLLRTLRCMERADVAMVVVDASQGFLDGDKRVIGFAHDAGRALVIVMNKWDLCDGQSMREVATRVSAEVPFASYASVVFTSAVTGTGVPAALDTAFDAAGSHALRIGTGDLNRLLQDAVQDHPYMRKGKELRLKYATMPDVKPPTIVAFVNDPELVHFSYARYLENRIRETYSYEGTPIRLNFRTAKRTRG